MPWTFSRSATRAARSTRRNTESGGDCLRREHLLVPRLLGPGRMLGRRDRWGTSYGSEARHGTDLRLSHAYRRAPAEPRKVPQVRHGVAVGRHPVRHAATHGEQPTAPCHHGGGHDRRDGGGNDDAALKAQTGGELRQPAIAVFSARVRNSRSISLIGLGGLKK